MKYTFLKCSCKITEYRINISTFFNKFSIYKNNELVTHNDVWLILLINKLEFKMHSDNFSRQNLSYLAQSFFFYMLFYYNGDIKLN